MHAKRFHASMISLLSCSDSHTSPTHLALSRSFRRTWLQPSWAQNIQGRAGQVRQATKQPRAPTKSLKEHGNEEENEQELAICDIQN